MEAAVRALEQLGHRGLSGGRAWSDDAARFQCVKPYAAADASHAGEAERQCRHDAGAGGADGRPCRLQHQRSGRAIRRAVDDGRVTYTLGYYSSDEVQDGKFREVKVSVDRPHLDVRFRKGYFAPLPIAQTAEARKREMRAAVRSPLESTAIPIGARVDFIDEARRTVNVFVQFDPSTIGFTHEADRWKAAIDIAYVQRTSTDASRVTARSTICRWRSRRRTTAG